MDQHLTRRNPLKFAPAATAISYSRVAGANNRVRTALVDFELVAVSGIWKVRREEGRDQGGAGAFACQLAFDETRQEVMVA